MNIKLVLFLYIIKLITLEICNYSFTCDLKEDDNYCAVKKRTDSNSIYEVKVKRCSSVSCNIHDTLLGDVEKNTTCQISSDNKYKNPSYPGGVCSDNYNCLSGICIDNICISLSKGEKCYSHEDCPINTACINGICDSYLKLNEVCEDSYQCEYDLFCNEKTGRCDELFKYKDRDEITGFLTKEKMDNICQSGGYITEVDSDYHAHIYCETLKNTQMNCNDICTYYLSNGKKYSSEEKCLCGYNKYRTKYCVLGNGEDIFIEFLNMKKEFIKNKELTKKCHTLERDFDEICLELINTNTTVGFRNYVKEYNNKKIMALQYHRLQESEPCIKEVVFNYESNPIFSLNQQCPKFICDPQKLNCLYGKNPLRENGDNITIALNPYSCSEKEYCSLPEENKLINTSLIMQKVLIEGQCKIYQGKNGEKRYPGESCNIKSDCLLETSTCLNGRCTGIGPGENCEKTEECVAGYYCNKEENRCISQKKEGQPCVEGWDCENFLGCFRGRCIKFGTLKKGIKITNITAPFPGNDLRNYLCLTGELNEENGKSGDFCVENDYDKTWLNETKKIPDKNGYIECNFGEECVYNNGRNKIIKYCECGYNSKGQGYCPLPSAKNEEAWKERIKFIGESANNNCHTLSRLNCYENNNYEYFVEKRTHESKTVEAHLFYNSIDCAFKIFASQNNLRFCLYFISIILILLI